MVLSIKITIPIEIEAILRDDPSSPRPGTEKRSLNLPRARGWYEHGDVFGSPIWAANRWWDGAECFPQRVSIRPMFILCDADIADGELDRSAPRRIPRERQEEPRP
jgi:hypothetical protein